MTIKKIGWDDFKTTKWSGGTTSEIYIDPVGEEVNNRNFDVRVSTATCEMESSEFSDYTGYTRTIAPVNGELTLFINNSKVFLRPYEVLRFNGSDKVTSVGTVRDYNLIAKNDVSAELQSMVIEEMTGIKLTGDTYLIHAFDEQMEYEFGDQTNRLEAGEALLIEGEEGTLKLFPTRQMAVFITQIKK